jgi:hypothetical protein
MDKLFKCLTPVLLFVSGTIADLITITAVGNVTSTLNSSVAVGTSVEYTFMYDLGLDGYTLNGEITTYFDTEVSNYFFSDFIGDYVLEDYGMPSTTVERNYGMEFLNGNGSYLYGGAGWRYVRLSVVGFLNDLTIGSSMDGYERTLTPSRTLERIDSKLTVTNIATVTDVPEGSTMMMMASGLCIAVLGAFKSRRNA